LCADLSLPPQVLTRSASVADLAQARDISEGGRGGGGGGGGGGLADATPGDGRVRSSENVQEKEEEAAEDEDRIPAAAGREGGGGGAAAAAAVARTRAEHLEGGGGGGGGGGGHALEGRAKRSPSLFWKDLEAGLSLKKKWVRSMMGSEEKASTGIKAPLRLF
jgi:hypothetical protein